MKRLLSLLAALLILLTGCFSYRDINKLIFVSMTLIDMDENGDVILYFEAFRPFRSEESPGGRGERLVYRTHEKTILEAIRDLNLGTSQKLNFTQNKALIFTKRAAEKGLDNFIDMLNRDQEFLLRQYMYILEQDPMELMNLKLPEEEYIGIFLYELPINQGGAAKRYVTRIDDYLNNRLIGNRVNILPVLFISSEHLDSKLRLKKAAVIKSDKYAGEMTFDETAIYNTLTGPMKSGTLIVEEDDNIMTLEIVGSKVKSKLEYDGESIKLIKDISIRTTFASTRRPLELNQPEVREEILKKSESNVKKQCEKLFEKWKEKNIDIFKITESFQKIYPDEELPVKDLIEISELEVSVRIFMEGSTDVTDYVK